MTTFHGLVTRSWLAQPKGKHRLLCSCIKLIGVTSLGRHLRPACNQGLLEIQLNKKTLFWPQYSVFLWTSGRAAMSLPVTSLLLPPRTKDPGISLGVAVSVRGSIQHPVFSNLWPPMRGDWGAVWGSRTRKLTLSPRLRRVWGTPKQLLSRPLIGRNGSREHKWWRSNANETRDPLKQYPYCLSRALIGYYLV